MRFSFLVLLLTTTASNGQYDYYEEDSEFNYAPEYYTQENNTDLFSAYDNELVFADDPSDGYIYDGDYGEESTFSNVPMERIGTRSNEILHEIEPYRALLNVLYNSTEVADEKVFRVLRHETYWNLQKVEFGLNLTMQNSNAMTSLTQSQIDDVSHIRNLLRQRMVEIFNEHPRKWLLQSMHKHRLYLARSYSDETIFTYFHELMMSVNQGTWNCMNGIVLRIWKSIAYYNSSNTGTHHEEMDEQKRVHVQRREQYYALVRIAMIVKVNSAEGLTDAEELEIKLKADLLTTLSEPDKLHLLNRTMGKENLEILIQDILCSELSLSMLNLIMKQLSEIPPSEIFPADIKGIMDIQHKLCQITNKLNKHEAFKDDGKSSDPNEAHDMLTFYMDIVDHTMDEGAVNAWGELENHDVNANLHNLLLNTELYVGVASDAIFSRSSKESQIVEIDKSAVSIKIHEIKNDSREARFSFDNAEIEMDTNAGGSNLKVYSVNYKSYSNVLDNIERYHEKHNKGSLIVHNKTFVSDSGVISFSARNSTGRQSVPVTFKIKFGKEFTNSHRANQNPDSEDNYRCLSCEFLDAKSFRWKTGGCSVVAVDRGSITCKCNHTTNFAAFMMPAEITYTPTENEKKILNIVEKIGSWLSVLGLIFSLIVFAMVKKLIRNERLTVHIHLSSALLVVHILNLGSGIFQTYDGLCVSLTLLFHFFLLATFMWMLVEGIFLYIYVVQVFMHSKFDSYRWMYVVGWFLPAVIVAISAGIGIPSNTYVKLNDDNGHISESHTHVCPQGSVLYPPLPVIIVNGPYLEPLYQSCWLSTESGMIWSFLAPALLVLFFNMVILCKTLQVCMKTMSSNKTPEAQRYVLRRNTADAMSNPPVAKRQISYDSINGDVFAEDAKPPPILIYSSNSLLQITSTSSDEQNEIDSISETRQMCSPGQSQSTTMLLDDNEQNNRLLSVSENQKFPSRYSSIGSAEPKSRTTTVSSVNYRNPPATKKSQNYRRSIVSPASKMGYPDGRNRMKEIKTTIKGTMILLPVLGVPWICGVLSHLSMVFSLIFVLINTTQGLAIFIVYCVLNGEVRRALQRRLAVTKLRHSLKRSNSNSSMRSRIFFYFPRRRSTVFTSAASAS